MGTKNYNNATDLVSFSRASEATYTDKDGDQVTASANEPRIDYDENGVLKGLLIEEARTNLFLNSDAPETQVVAVTPNSQHTLSFEGGSSVVDLDETIAATAVDVFVYDTSKDSDGGAWRTGALAQASSWYNETLNTATRGSRREFPAVAVIVAENGTVTIYDGDDPSLPMWMVFNAGTYAYIRGTSGLTSVFASNGKFVVGDAASGVAIWDMIADKSEASIGFATLGYYIALPVSGRNNTDSSYRIQSSDVIQIVNSTVNDVAMTVLPDAPTDPATGLPVPTIAVATAGGVSVIKDDGTVVDLTYTASVSNEAGGVWFPDAGGIAWQSRSSSGGYVYTLVENEIPTSDKSAASDALYANFGQANFATIDLVTLGTSQPRTFLDGAIGSPLGFTRIDEKRTAPSEGMVAYTTSTYNTGWMNGDIKGAFLSDTDDTDLVGSGELVTNGTFDSDTDWTKGTGWTISGGQAVATAVTSAAAIAQPITRTAGKVYKISVDVSGSSGSYSLNINGAGTGDILTGDGTKTVYTVASTTGSLDLQIQQRTGATLTGNFDNISVKLADADRSVNAQGLVINGTVSRDPVSSGADLVAYSGFSASNYLEQPYNSDLDFGTGDFCVMGWIGGTKSGQVFDRFDPSEAGARFSILLAGSYTRFFTSLGFFDAPGLPHGQFNFLVMVRRSGVLYGYVDGNLVGSTTSSGSMTNTSANLRVGTRANTGTSPILGSLALLRISATAPTAEQIAKIYNDEKVLFQENAKATLYGSSDAVTALAYDDDTNLLHVGTSAGRSVFQGLRRVDNTTDAVGAAISASNGLVAED